MFKIEYVIAACPDATASAAGAPSSAATRFSNTSVVGFMIREYILPNSFKANRFAACSVSRKPYEVVWYSGTARDMVVGSSSWPA